MQAETDDPETGADRIAEIGAILALGLLRLRARQSREFCAEGGDSSLDFVGGKSGHANSETERNGR
jgi:hypothetical protein